MFDHVSFSLKLHASIGFFVCVQLIVAESKSGVLRRLDLTTG